VVEEVVAERAAGPRRAAGGGARAALPVTRDAIRNSDPVLAATALAAALEQGQPLADAQPVPVPEQPETARGIGNTAWQCSKLALQLAWAKANGDTYAVQELGDELNYGTCDPLWAHCVEKYVLYFKKNKGTVPYRSGGDYVLNVPVPKKAKIAVFGDWATGTQLATTLLGQIARKEPDLVFHLGDIYYSGTQDEVQTRFLDVCQRVLGNTPVFSLAGNHDMYSGGQGYYWLVDQLRQQASYFCLRNDNWQLLAMDTGYNDFSPFSVSSNVTYLTEVEAEWHKAKLLEGRDAGRRTVLLSHHQLFSAYDAIGKGAGVNRRLLGQFQDLLDQVEIWFWGHEHALSIYAPFQGLKRGRCLGCGAIPVFVEEEFYVSKYDVPLLPDPNNPDQPIKLGDNGTVYNHAYAIMTVDGRSAEVAYYQDTDEVNPLYVERIESDRGPQ
jgi:hypothetical protein